MSDNNSPQFKFRETQWEIINYSRGLMGVSAVPGSGKTFTLSHLAAQLVQRLSTRRVTEKREVLIVTFTNSAVNSFKSRIAQILQVERGLLPYTGYRVRTLHGLAHDIVRERPSLVGLSEDFQIVDDRTATTILQDAVNAHLTGWKSALSYYLSDELTEGQERRVLHRDLPNMMGMLVWRFISRAKELLKTPEDLENALESASTDFDIARFAVAIYKDYQRSLAYRGSVDFDDLVHLALQALRTDEKYLKRLQDQWTFILEDEAQDSSWLQEQMLELLTGGKNWVRVGDPNQAINTTFTTADPRYLRDFLERESVKQQPLHTSGRSSRKIINLANELVRWTAEAHPVKPLQNAFLQQQINPTEPGDVQLNPVDSSSNIYIHGSEKQLSPDDELNMVVRSLQKWLPDNEDKTVAVLVPENNRGFKLAEILRNLDLPYEELLRSTTETRQTATVLSLVLRFLSDPRSSLYLARVYHRVWLEHISPLEFSDSEEDNNLITLIERSIRNIRQLEDLIYPVDGHWESTLDLTATPQTWQDDFDLFLSQIRRWLDALSLPIDQMVLTVGGDIFKEPSDVALTYKIAVVLKSIARDHPTYRLSEFVEELIYISENQRKFIGFDDSDTGYEPTPGRITVSTMHAAKGLEWDRVYLMAVNNYSFPSALDYEEYIGERWFIRDNLNLEAEVEAQLEALVDQNTKTYTLGDASYQARFDYAAERLRLLYVGITRAKSDLIITWNTGRFWERGGNSVKQPTLPLIHLMEYSDA